MIEASSLCLITRCDLLLLEADAIVIIVNWDGRWVSGVNTVIQKYAELSLRVSMNNAFVSEDECNVEVPDESILRFDNVFLFRGNFGQNIDEITRDAMIAASNQGFDVVIVPASDENSEAIGVGIGKFLRERPTDFETIFVAFHREPRYIRRPGNPFSGYELKSKRNSRGIKRF